VSKCVADQLKHKQPPLVLLQALAGRERVEMLAGINVWPQNL
jgi:hypothetical protein